MPASYTTGTVVVTQDSTTVTGTSTVWTSTMVGRQFRTGTTSPLYTIRTVNSATSLTLDLAWGPASASVQSYEIYLAYVTPPTDFHAFISVWDPTANWQLWTNRRQQDLNRWDPQRANSGQSWFVVPRDYSISGSGIVLQPVQVDGSGPDPISGGTYTGPADAVLTVEITTGGAAGTAVYRWKKDGGAYTSGVTTDGTGGLQDLRDGVQVAFPTGATYVLGDIWVIQVRTLNTVGLPRYELWPHQKATYVYPYLYEARATDLQDTGAVLPRYIRGDMLMEMALAEAASWPGATADNPNPYYDLALARRHDARCDQMLAEMERQDDEVSMQDLWYDTLNMPWAPLPDAAWMQSHDAGWMAAAY